MEIISRSESIKGVVCVLDCGHGEWVRYWQVKLCGWGREGME